MSTVKRRMFPEAFKREAVERIGSSGLWVEEKIRGRSRILTRLVALEPSQADLLRRIVEGPTIDADTLRGGGTLSDTSADAAELVEIAECEPG